MKLTDIDPDNEVRLATYRPDERAHSKGTI